MLFTCVTLQNPYRFNTIDIHDMSKKTPISRMANLQGCIPIQDVLIDFQAGKMSCALPKGILEVVLMAKSNWGQAQIIENQVYKYQYNMALDQALPSSHHHAVSF